MTIQEEVDELIKRLNDSGTDDVKIEMLPDLIKKSISIQYVAVETFIEQLLHLSEKLNRQAHKAWGIYYMALLQRQKGDYYLSITLCNQAKEIFEGLQDLLGVSASFNNLGIVNHLIGNFPEALKNHLSALKLRHTLRDKSGIALSHMNIGNVHFVSENFEDALRDFIHAKTMFEDLHDEAGVANVRMNIGNVYEKQGSFEDALDCFNSALDYAIKVNNKLSVANAYGNIGVVQFRMSKFSDALESYRASIKLKEEIGDRYGVVSLKNNIATVYKDIGNYHEAIDAALEAIRLGEELGHKQVVRESMKLVSQTYRQLNQFESALDFYERYHQLDIEISGATAQKQIANLGFQHQIQQKERLLEVEYLRNVELRTERDRSESLLLNILPAEVAEELKTKGTAEAKLFNDVTVFFSDFKSFTTISEKLSPQQLVDELHECFSAFDHIIQKYGIEKIKTVGDAYLAVSGLPLANPNHASDMIKAALEIQEFISTRKSKAPFGGLGAVRIGIHSGSVVAGIVGVKKFAYDIWGDTVNTAARMEQNGEAGKVNISQATYELVKDKFACEFRGEIEAKNKGKLKMYFVHCVDV
jgi:class 3 adenylate cyclase